MAQRKVDNVFSGLVLLLLWHRQTLSDISAKRSAQEGNIYFFVKNDLLRKICVYFIEELKKRV